MFASFQNFVQKAIDFGCAEPDQLANAQSVFDEADWFVVWAQDLWGINDVEALDNYMAAADKLKTAFETLI